eukprot:948089-Pleurochrysis_carterae.AAC.1
MQSAHFDMSSTAYAPPRADRSTRSSKSTKGAKSGSARLPVRAVRVAVVATQHGRPGRERLDRAQLGHLPGDDGDDGGRDADLRRRRLSEPAHPAARGAHHLALDHVLVWAHLARVHARRARLARLLGTFARGRHHVRERSAAAAGRRGSGCTCARRAAGLRREGESAEREPRSCALRRARVWHAEGGWGTG